MKPQKPHSSLGSDPELNFLAARVFCRFCFRCFFGLSEPLAMTTSGSAHDLSTLLAPVGRNTSPVIVYAVDLRSSPDHPLDDAVETFVRREDAERFIEEVRGDDLDLASHLRIKERELEAGGLN